MSLTVCLADATGECVKLPEPHTTIVIPTTDRRFAQLMIPDPHFAYLREHWGPTGLRWLRGQRASDTIAALETVIATLEGEPTDDFWETAPGNLRVLLSQLLEWAIAYPDTYWH